MNIVNYEYLEEQVEKGKYSKNNLQTSPNAFIQQSDIDMSYNCKVVVDEYIDLNGNDNYVVEVTNYKGYNCIDVKKK